MFIAILDLITLLFTVLGIVITIVKSTKLKFKSFVFLKIIFLFFFGIYSFFLFIEWAGFSLELNEFEDLSGAILPILWIIIFYLLVDEVKIEQIKESEENWRITFSSIGDAIITTDNNGIVTRMNPTAEKLTGWSVNQAKGLELTEVFKIFDSETKKQVSDPIREVLQTGKIIDLSNHTVLVGRDTLEYHISDSAAPIKDASGNILGAVLVFSDITEKYQLQKKIAEDQQRFELVLKGANLGIWDWNVETGEVLFNENWASMLGYSQSEIEPRYEAWEKLLHPQDMPSIIEKLNKHLKGELPTYEVEFRMKTKDNKWKWILSKGKVMEWDSNRKPLRALGTHVDITIRKQAEYVIKESENSLRKIFDAISDAVFLFPVSESESSKFVAVNDTACRRYEYDRESFLNLSSKDITEIEKSKLSLERKNLEQVKELGHYIFESKHVSKSGKVFPVEINSSIIEHKGTPMILAVARDITERKKMELYLKESNEKYLRLNKELLESVEKIQDINAQLEESKEKAEESDRLKTAFLANLSHEVRTPMNGIMGFIELLKQGNVPEDKQKEFINAISLSSDRMLRLIEDLVDISKIESNTVDVSEKLFVLNDVISEMMSFFKPQAEKKGLVLKRVLEIDDPEFVIVTDRKKLEQTLTNLIHNAIKFTEEGIIEFGCKLRSKQLYFWVKDSGKGISKDKQKEIFERFRQESTNVLREAEGMGLGLSISKAFVEKLGGEIGVESKEGKGSEFWFTLPFKKSK